MTVEKQTFAEALVEAQKLMPLTVQTDSENPHFRSRFLSLGGLIVGTRTHLNDCGFAITQFPGVNEQGQPVLRTTLTHGPSGEERTYEMPLFPDKPGMQAYGAAITYGRRYSWAALLGIASEEDTDGNVPAGSAEPAEPARTRTNPPAEKPAEPERPGAATKPQKTKMAILVKELGADQVPLPADYAGAEHWTDVLRMRLNEQYGVTTRTDLTVKQASEVIDWLEAQAIPF